MYLSPLDLETLTGYKRHADQRRWLEARGWKFEIARNGRPVVLRAYCEQRMVVVQTGSQGMILDFTSIRKAT